MVDTLSFSLSICLLYLEVHLMLVQSEETHTPWWTSVNEGSGALKQSLLLLLDMAMSLAAAAPAECVRSSDGR